ncbi:ferredoxin [Actinomadura rugatobispora]|uniref:Ferredoxin n=1 Tax=Actinomadura rugatobispora TaxID=1994 RepID=A0ABW1A480_9ACTN|nr:ferredoxin [Actinomadura rugatobispora]
MDIEADRERCVGAGQCALAAPGVFDQREADGLVEVLDRRPPRSRWQAVREAEALCPAAAIAVSDD